MAPEATPEAATASGSRYQVRATADSHFSWMRTRFSIERTFMSWVRTAVSLIGFGFTIVQFFERFGRMEGVREAARPEMPRFLGLALIASGLIALGISLWQYVTTVNYLNSPEFAAIAAEKKRHSPLMALAILLVLIGLFAFFSVLLRL